MSIDSSQPISQPDDAAFVPVTPKPQHRAGFVSKAAADNTVNGSKTSGAPQQSVVNGWYQNELAEIQTSQNTYLAASSARNEGLLGLLVLAVTGEIVIRAFERKPSVSGV